jgi:hypothetical protein
MTGDAKSDPLPLELRPWQQVSVFLAACIAFVTRMPDAVFRAGFWAEDGHVFFADAYNLGWWHALFNAYNGYFLAVPRLVAALALLAPLRFAPLVLNIAAILIAALPVSLLFSPRSAAWGDIRFRGFLTGTYLGLPNITVIHHGITESQFLLALGAFLLIVAAPARTKSEWVADVLFILLAGLSGPFCIFLLPISLFLAWRRRGLWARAMAGILAFCVGVQCYALLVVNATGRPKFALGASLIRLVRIFGGNVISGAVLGPNRIALIPGRGAFIALLCLAIAGIAMGAVCWAISTTEMRLFLVFAILVLTASLLSPTVYPFKEPTAWDFLERASMIRYWLLPSLAFVWSVLWCAQRGNAVLKFLAVVFLVPMGFSMVLYWRQQPFIDLHYADYARQFESAPPGTVMTIPENPLGWNLVLMKHGAR